MTELLVTEHCIVFLEDIISVTVTRSDNSISMGNVTERPLYSILGHRKEQNPVSLYVDLRYEEIPEKMKLIERRLQIRYYKPEVSVSSGPQ